MREKKSAVLTSVIILLPVLAGIVLWSRLPDQIATHFNTQGVPDRYDSKAFTVFGIPLILLAIHLVCLLVSRKDFEKAGAKMVHVVLWIVPGISLFVMSSIYYSAVTGVMNIPVLMIFSSLLFIIIGNYLPKVKRNTTIGIKLPWTLDDEENWNRTHRFAGKVWVISGIADLLMTFVGVNPVYMITIFIAVVVALPVLYSWAISRK